MQLSIPPSLTNRITFANNSVSVGDLQKVINPMGTPASQANYVSQPSSPLYSTMLPQKPTLDQLTPIINQTAQKYNLHPEMLRALVRKESGSPNSPILNTKNQKYDEGQYGYLVGLIKAGKGGAVDQLSKTAPVDANTPEGALDAAARYLTYLSKKYKTTDSASLYNLYNGGGTPNAGKVFATYLTK